MVELVEKIDRLVKWAKGGKAPPITLELNPTNKCNLSCLFCWLRSTRPPSEELSDERLLSIPKEAAELGVKEFRIPGCGEPLMRKEVVLRIMEEVKEYGMEGLLITNGTLLDGKSIKKVVKIGWDIITFSLDGPNSRVNDYLRGRGSFEKIVRAIRRTNEIAKLYRKRPILRLNVVLTNRNYDRLEEMIRLAHELRCDEVLLQPMTIFSELGKKLELNEKEREQLNKLLRRALKLAQKLGIFTNMASFIGSPVIGATTEMDRIIKEEVEAEKGFLSSPCFEPFYNLIIMPDGTASPCAISGGVVGDDIQHKSLAEVWFGGVFRDIRSSLSRGKLFDFCRNCCVPVFEENRRIRTKLKEMIGWREQT
jgi:MoaA/NifB/PqqE/SkfB family radical SAM enzyme